MPNVKFMIAKIITLFYKYAPDNILVSGILSSINVGLLRFSKIGANIRRNIMGRLYLKTSVLSNAVRRRSYSRLTFVTDFCLERC